MERAMWQFCFCGEVQICRAPFHGPVDSGIYIPGVEILKPLVTLVVGIQPCEGSEICPRVGRGTSG